MPLEGSLDAVERFQARGWAWDKAQPGRTFEVEILVSGKSTGKVMADLYRADLAEGRIGGGYHSFVFNFPEPLAADVLDAVTAQVSDGGTTTPLERWRDGMPGPEKEPAAVREVVFRGPGEETPQHPLFILGAARSGTTALTQALLKATPYQGFYEGHLLDLLAEFYVTLDRFYRLKADEWLDPGRSTTIKHVPIQYFREGFESVFIAAMGELFPTGWWLDKTPAANMIHIAGRLRQIWPEAKFIYLKRRAFENIASRRRKFPDRSFEIDCREWAAAMRAWREVRPELAGCALQIDQLHLAQASDKAAAEIAAFLGLNQRDTRRLRQALLVDRPERTGDMFAQVYTADELGWIEEQWAVFDAICGPELDWFGYSRDRSYFVDDASDRWVHRF